MLYRTVFGAVWVYFGKEPSTIEVINDIDKELINLFKMIKYHSSEIERLLEYEFSGRDIFEEYKNYNVNYLTEIHRAIRFLYLITQSFAGKGKTYGYGTTTKPSQKIFYNPSRLSAIIIQFFLNIIHYNRNKKIEHKIENSSDHKRHHSRLCTCNLFCNCKHL